MRSFLVLPAAAALLAASLVQAGSERVQARTYGKSTDRLVTARDVEAALDVLRRANYKVEDHLAKRDDIWKWNTGDHLCYCKPYKHQPHPTTTSHGVPATQTPEQPDHHHDHGHHPTSSHHHHHHHSSSREHHHHSSSTIIDKSTPTHPSSEPPCTTSKDQTTPTSNPSDHTTATSTGTTSTVVPTSTGQPTCPSGYKQVSKGNTIITNDNDLIDLKGLNVNLDILNFFQGQSSPSKSSPSVDSKPKCDADYCCWKPGHPSQPSCPSGYKQVSKGNTIITNDNDLIDLKGLSVNLDLLNFFSGQSAPTKSTPSVDSKPKCDADYCCWKPGQPSQPSCPSGYQQVSKGNTIITNDNDLIDLKGLNVNLDLLNFFSGQSAPTKSTPSVDSKPKCDADYCCWKPGQPSQPSCPSGYKSASRGDALITNDNDLIDAKGISISLDLLNFSNGVASPIKSTKPASGSAKCDSDYCCYKPTSSGGGDSTPTGPGSNDGGPQKATCPAGYTSYGKGETIIKNDNDLIDLKDLTISLNILSFPTPGATPKQTTKSPADKPTCDEATCCVQQTSTKGGKTISNDNDLVDAKGLTVKVCVLFLCV